MDLDSIAQMMDADAGEHPSRRDVQLETNSGAIQVKGAIKRGMPRDWQASSNAVLEISITTYVLLARNCSVKPDIGFVIVDGSERWSIRQISEDYGGLAYRCSAVRQT